MSNIKNKAFTLVELLVVITILAIISVVAYQNFGGAVDKAVSGRKISDVSTIETSLQQYRTAENYYPSVGEYSDTNLWGYTGSWIASSSNKIQVTYNGEEIESLLTGTGGGIIYGSGTLGQIGAKGTVGKKQLGKYLTKDLYDPEVGDVKVNKIDGTNPGKMIDLGVGRYVYSIYRKSYDWNGNNKKGSSYNIAFTIKKSGNEEGYITKIVGDYDKANYGDLDTYPKTLIGTMSGSNNHSILKDGVEQFGASNSYNYGVPYAVNDFAK